MLIGSIRWNLVSYRCNLSLAQNQQQLFPWRTLSYKKGGSRDCCSYIQSTKSGYCSGTPGQQHLHSDSRLGLKSCPESWTRLLDMIFPPPSHATFLVVEPCLSHCSHPLGWASCVITGIQNDSSLHVSVFNILSINPVLDQTGVHYILLYLVTEGPPGLRQIKFCILSDKASRMIELPKDDLFPS